jgi:hypothetical protein
MGTHACPVEARYVYDYDVYRMLNRARRERSGWHLGWRALTMVSLFFGAFTMIGLYEGWLLRASTWRIPPANLIASIVAACAVLIAFMALVDLVFDRFVHRLVFRRYSQANSELALSFSADAIRWSGRGVKGEIAYGLVKGITRLKDGSGAVAWIGKVEGIVVPRRAFSPEAGFETALKLIENGAAKG